MMNEPFDMEPLEALFVLVVGIGIVGLTLWLGGLL